MPCYNTEKYVDDAINSILNQTFTDFELIIINDGSTDETHAKICAHHDPKILYIPLQQNQGKCKALNTGMQKARGKYICVMDSDHIAHADRLQNQYNYLETHKTIDMIGGQATVIDGEGQFTGQQFSQPVCSPGQLKVYLLTGNHTLHSSLFFRKKILWKPDLYYNERYKILPEYDFVVRAAASVSVKNIDQPVIQYRRYRQAVSATAWFDECAEADAVRLDQLRKIVAYLNGRQINAYQKLMKKEPLENIDEIKTGLSLFNQMLENNNHLRIYKRTRLFNLLDYLIDEAHQKMKKGMSIEDQLLSFIEHIVQKNQTILEFGSGMGTDKLLRNFKVISIEHDKTFAVSRGEDHQCFFCPIVSDAWYDPQQVAKAMQNQIALVLVDGPPQDMRKGILSHLDLFTDLKAPVIFDDVNRPLDRETMMAFCKALKYEYTIMDGELKQFGYCTPA